MLDWLSPLSMLKIRLIAPDRHLHPLLDDLGQLGLIQLTDPKRDDATEAWLSRDHASAREQNSLRLSRIDRLYTQLGLEKPANPSAPLPLLSFDIDEALVSLQERVVALEEQKRQLETDSQSTAELDSWLSVLSRIGLEPGETGDSSFLWLQTGTVPEGNWEEVQQELGPSAALVALPSVDGHRAVAVLAAPEQRPRLEAVLRKAEFERRSVPTQQQVRELESRRPQDLNRELETVEEQLRSLREDAKSTLARSWAQVEVDRRLLAAKDKILGTERTFLLEGWLPAVDWRALEDCVRRRTDGCYLLEAVVAEDLPNEQVPTLLGHGRLLRPFAMLVNAYGLPAYGEIVPTLFLALTYAVMFGVMFGDWGHGLALIAVGVCAMRSKRTWAHDTGVLAIVCGLSSVAFGLVYGSFFGIEGFKTHALWHDPLEGNPAELMVATIALGAVVLSLGVILNVANKVRQGQVQEAILGKFGALGLLFYWGLIATAAMVATSTVTESRAYWLAAVVGTPVLVWSLREPAQAFVSRLGPKHEHGEGIGTAVASSLVEAFDAVLVFFANSISFVRLAAYAMSHAALLMAMFTLAEQVESVPTVGPFLRVLIIAIGNLIVIVLEGIIAAVQALRLQYYEFFGKFYSGSGHAFDPFRLWPDRR